MDYNIEKNVPIVKKGQLKPWEDDLPFDKMDIGDSFEAGDYSLNDMSKLNGKMLMYCRRSNNEAKFSLRKVEGDKIRCWRVK